MDYQAFHDPDVIATALRAGNRDAFQFIIHQFGPALCFFATRLTGNELAAARIAEAVIVKLWASRKKFYSLIAIRNFLYASTREGCFLHIKKQQPAILDEQGWLQLWQKTESYVQCEVIRAEVLRQVCNNIDHRPLLPSTFVHARVHNHDF